MTLKTLIDALKARLALARRRRQDWRALSHLDAHMLRDLGLRAEQGTIVPIATEPTQAAMPAPAITDSQKTAAAEAPQKAIRVCRYCGETLA
ncbi:hypothetical protein GY26_05080 [Gammaproteobacteria bacterium MFB021]|nr:hypothetical protein GY26_05080 [Gammaproteobacteria bacterium MFB021]